MHEPPENYGSGPLPPDHGGYPPGTPHHPYADQGNPSYGAPHGQQPGQAEPPYGQPPYPGQGQPPYPGQDPYGGQGQPPYPGQGQPPYPGQQPYGAPQQPPGGGWGQGGGFGPPPGPGWGPQPPGPPRKSSGPIVVMAIVAVLVVLGGGGAIIWALSGHDNKPKHTPVAASSLPALPPVPSFPTTLPTPGESPPLPLPSSTDGDQSMFVQAGDCVRISGKAPHLRMLREDCGNAPYKVLRRFSGTADQKKCRNVPGFTTVFYAKNTQSSFLSYVLCLKHL